MDADSQMRTVQLKLDLIDNAKDLLAETIRQYRWAANYVVDSAWEDGEPETLTRTELHHDTYETVRDQTDLHANHVQLARNRAAEAMTAVVERRNQGHPAGKPQFTSDFLDYITKSFTVHDDYASLATVDGRVHADFVLPSNPDTPPHRYFLNADYDVGRSTLIPKQDAHYLHLTLDVPVSTESLETETPAVLGVDLGLSNIAVSSTGRFWNGDEITHWRNQYQRRRRSLQQRRTRWAHEALQRLSQRVHGRVRQRLHRVANEIVSEAVEGGCPVVAFEDLSNLYDRIQHFDNIRSWAYRLLVEYVRYKGECAGLKTVQVDPEDTSQRCSTCGYTDPSNRTTQERFECGDCGYRNHADYNAAKNIGLTYLRQHQTGTDGDAPVGVRVNSGVITDSGYQRIESDA